jgi:sugar lactone lactonase YvrE
VLLAGQPGGQGWVDGPGKAAHFQGPYGIALDETDHLYLTETSLLRDFEFSSSTIRTLAGRLDTGGDDGPGARATFFHPTGMAVEGGALFVSDTENHALRRIDVTTGDVTTAAGQIGVVGSDDGPGAQAHFQEPEGLALDGPARQLYISDTDNHTIRRLDLASGAVTTVAGAPTASGDVDAIGAAARFSRPTALALDETAKVLFICDAGNQKIRSMTLGDASVATIASLDEAPHALAMNGSELVAAVGSEIVTVSQTTGALVALAGSATPGFVDAIGADARFGAPEGMVADRHGGMLVADSANHAVRRLDLGSGAVTTVVGANSSGAVDGEGDQARFSRPQGLVAGHGGRLFVADTENHAIRTVTLTGGNVATLAGSLGEAGHVDATGTLARFNRPSGLAFDGSHSLYVVELGNQDLRRVDLASGTVSTLTLTARASSDPLTMNAPLGLAFDRGVLYVTDGTRVLAVDIATSEISVLAKDPGASSVFASLGGIVADGHGSVFVADVLKNSVMKVATDTGAVTTAIGTTGLGADRLYYPRQLALGPDGTLFVADAYTVRQVTKDGSDLTTVVGALDRQGVRPGPLPAQLGDSTALAVTEDGTIAVVSESSILIAQ